MSWGSVQNKGVGATLLSGERVAENAVGSGGGFGEWAGV